MTMTWHSKAWQLVFACLLSMARQGALIQETIDVAVVLNALLALAQWDNRVGIRRLSSRLRVTPPTKASRSLVCP